MATISEIRNLGTELILADRGLPEPLNPPESILRKLDRFGEHYNLNQNSHLVRFILATCGEAGAQSLKRETLYPRLKALLDSVHFDDLDSLYGNPLHLPRVSPEVYEWDPKAQILTQAQWQEIRQKDAAYRNRCLLWMRAILHGPTTKGIALAAEAACGIECRVFEQYQYVENLTSDDPISMSNIGMTNSRNEVVIIPNAPSLSEEDRKCILRLVDRLRPVNTIVSVYEGESIRLNRPALEIQATSNTFYVDRLVTGRPDVDWIIDSDKGLWIDNEERPAPVYAFMDRQEVSTYLTVNSVTASSSHTGFFSKKQRELFGHLDVDKDKFRHYSSDNSYLKSFAPINVLSRWINDR